DEASHNESLNGIDKFDFHNIEKVHLHPSSSSLHLIKILSLTKKVRSLSLRWCENIDTFLPKDIPDNMILENLEEINVSFSVIRGDTLAKLISKAPKLKYVNADNCKNFSSFNLSQLENVCNLKFHEFSVKDNLFSEPPLKELFWLL